MVRIPRALQKTTGPPYMDSKPNFGILPCKVESGDAFQ